MAGKIDRGQMVTVAPVTDPSTLKVGDIVLCKVGGFDYLHLVKAIQNGKFQIGNNRGGINGWISINELKPGPHPRLLPREIRAEQRLSRRRGRCEK